MDSRYKTPQYWSRQAPSVLIGGAGAFAFFSVIDIKGLSLDERIATVAGLMLLLIGLLIAAAALSPKPQVSRRRGWLSALSMTCCGVILMIPPLAPGVLDPGVAFGLFVVVLALSYLTNWLVLKDVDEMQRRMANEASVLGYYVFAAGVMLHAAASSLGLPVGIGLWPLIAILTVAQLVIATGVGWREQAPLPEE